MIIECHSFIVYSWFFTQAICSNIIVISKKGYKFVPEVVNLMTICVKKEPLSQKQLEIIQYNIDSALYSGQEERNEDGAQNGDDTEDLDTDSNAGGDKTVSTIISCYLSPLFCLSISCEVHLYICVLIVI